jgi:hypothetical protein
VPQQYAILPRATDPAAPDLGQRRDLVARLATLNTAPETEGDDVLWGPGFRLELTPDQNPVTQILLTVIEDEIAGLAIMRLGRLCSWRLVDLETGIEMEPE